MTAPTVDPQLNLLRRSTQGAKCYELPQASLMLASDDVTGHTTGNRKYGKGPNTRWVAKVVGHFVHTRACGSHLSSVAIINKDTSFPTVAPDSPNTPQHPGGTLKGDLGKSGLTRKCASTTLHPCHVFQLGSFWPIRKSQNICLLPKPSPHQKKTAQCCLGFNLV